MMPDDTYESLRAYYQPDKAEVLFVGESRPQGGTFFYQQDSSLYRETKKAFNEYFAQDIFTLGNFKKWNCWLYDICEKPVNGLGNAERIACIREDIYRLTDVLKKEKPRLIIVCKKTFIEPEIKSSQIMSMYLEGESIFFLSHPGYGNQRKYREGLKRALRAFNFKQFIADK